MAELRTSSQPELHLEVRRDEATPLHCQLERQLRDGIRFGRLPAGLGLPSTRALAAQLGVARGVAVEAYEQLVAEGYLCTRPGGSTTVARVPTAPMTTPAPSMEPSIAFDFRSGRPDLTEFPRVDWLRSVRRALTEAPADRLNYLGGHGTPELRAALATYLNRARGTNARPDRMVVTAGFAQGIHLVAKVLQAAGSRRIGLEDPYHPEYRELIRSAGVEVVGIPVDSDGLRVDRLDDAAIDAVVVTPAHQFPTGAVLAPERRAALIQWAERRGGTIIEDDYDAEFRYDREPIGAMQGLCADRVVYAGTASKTLAPGLRLGWLILPRRLVDGVVKAKHAADAGSGAIDQLALADFVDRGELDRHLRRMRTIYRRRRDVLLEALARRLPDWRPVGASAGLHVLAWLPPDLDEAAIVRAAAERGIALQGVAGGHLGPASACGIVFGYGSLDERRIDAGIGALADLVAGPSPG